MNKICTSLEQSKKLIELGVDVDTSDMVYLRSYFEDEGEYNLLVGSYHEGYMEKDDGTLIQIFDEHIPAWSLAALIDILPRFIEFKGDKYYLRFMKEYVEYANDEVSITGRCLHTTGNDNLVDACCEMIIKLKELNRL